MPTKTPIILLNLYLDDGTIHIGPKGSVYKNVAFSARVIQFGTIDRFLPTPPGLFQIDDATIRVADTDSQVRAWFDAITPLRRFADIIFDLESDVSLIFNNRALPLPPSFTGDPSTTGRDSEGPISDPTAKPIFRGEIRDVRFGPGYADIVLRDVMAIWFDHEMPKLITRDYFPNLPDDANEKASDYFAPIIFGHVESYSATNVEKQGVIRCWYVDTTRFLYCVARHSCKSILAVYRKRKGDTKFTLVNPTEYYTPFSEPRDIAGFAWNFTFIQFKVKQQDETVIHADVEGIDYRFDFTSDAQLFPSSVPQNPVDALSNLIDLALQGEPLSTQEAVGASYDTQSWIDAWNYANSAGYLCDGAITESMTVGHAMSQLCQDFVVDLYQTNDAKLAVGFYAPNAQAGEQQHAQSQNQISHYRSGPVPPVDNTPAVITRAPTDENLTVLHSFATGLPLEIWNRLRYRYFRQNAGLSEYVRSSNTGHWGQEEYVDNVIDQDEMTNTGANPLLEKIDEFFFIRDDTTAKVVSGIKLGYYTLRSYPAEFSLPVPEVFQWIKLGLPMALTHFQGFASGGWDNQLVKVTGLSFDLHDLVCRVKSQIVVAIPRQALTFSFDSTHPTHDVQKRLPWLAASVNGSLDGFGDVDPACDPSVNLNDSNPPAPDSPADVPSTLTFSFTDGTTDVLPTSEMAFVNLMWQEDRSLGIGTPRDVSAFVPIPGFKAQIRLYVGTLSPDLRPTLSSTDINKVLFYSTDFDHLYLYVGTDESGTPSGWRAVELTTGNVILRWDSPGAVGWHICDGSTVNKSDYKGDVASYGLPNLLSSGNSILGLSAVANDSLTSVDLTDNTSLPACLGATAITFDRFRLMPYMRL